MAERNAYGSVVDLFSTRLGPKPAAGALKDGDGGGTSGGMDDWQQTVETRLGQLHTDISGVRSDVRGLDQKFGAMAVDIGKLTTRVDHLPSKGFIITTVLGTGAALAAITVFGPTLAHLMGMH